MNPTVAAAAAAIARLRAVQADATRTLAQRCSRGGKLDAALLDKHQVASFELAWAEAELLAAHTLLHAPARDAVESRLANLFATDAFASAAARLEGILIELDADLSPLRAAQDDADALRMRREATTPDALDATGAAVAAADGEVGLEPLDEDHVLVQDTFRRFARDAVMPLAERVHRDDLTVPESLLGPLREMGVFGLSVPQRFGGTAPEDGEGALATVIATEALSEASLGAAGSLITRPEILCRALLAGGTEAQKQAWLPRIAAGDPLCAIAMTEPDHGSDVASVNLRATRVPEGWRLNGAKTWCTFAGKAGLIMVVARTNADASLGYKGLSVLLVEKPSHEGHDFEVAQPGGGRLTGRAIPTIGYRGMHSYDLAFDDFIVPAGNLIGEEAGEGKGFYFTMAGMMGGRMQTAARACGVMRAALRAAGRYAVDRKVFGRPLADYPLTRAKLARMGAKLAACRRLAAAVARMVDRGEGRMEASLVKLLACRQAEWVTREAMQLHGGMGYAEESAVSRYFVDARVLSIFEGAEETLALKVIARALLERALEAS